MTKFSFKLLVSIIVPMRLKLFEYKYGKMNSPNLRKFGTTSDSFHCDSYNDNSFTGSFCGTFLLWDARGEKRNQTSIKELWLYISDIIIHHDEQT